MGVHPARVCGRAPAPVFPRTPTPETPKLRVAVDVDEVLARFVHNLNRFVYETSGTMYLETDYFEYNFAKVWDVDQPTSARIVHAFFESERLFQAGLPVIPGAKGALNRLKEQHGCEFVVVTSRQHVIADATVAWIADEFPELFDDVLFGNHWTLEPNQTSRTKAEMCAGARADVLVDDNVGYAQECAEAGLQVVLFGDYAWNAAAPLSLHPNVSRAATWAEAELALTNLALVKQMAAVRLPELPG